MWCCCFSGKPQRHQRHCRNKFINRCECEYTAANRWLNDENFDISLKHLNLYRRKFYSCNSMSFVSGIEIQREKFQRRTFESNAVSMFRTRISTNCDQHKKHKLINPFKSAERWHGRGGRKSGAEAALRAGFFLPQRLLFDIKPTRMNSISSDESSDTNPFLFSQSSASNKSGRRQKTKYNKNGCDVSEKSKNILENCNCDARISKCCCKENTKKGMLPQILTQLPQKLKNIGIVTKWGLTKWPEMEDDVSKSLATKAKNHLKSSEKSVTFDFEAYCQFIMKTLGSTIEVEIIRFPNEVCANDAGSGGLGFGIVGGPSTGVVVKTILPGSAAFKDNRLRAGDRILQVGRVNVQGMSSQQVAMLLRQSAADCVELVVGRAVDVFTTTVAAAAFKTDTSRQRLSFLL